MKNRFEGCVILKKEKELSEWGSTIRAVIQTKEGQLFYVVISDSFDLDGIFSDLSVFEVEEFDEESGKMELGEEISIRKKEYRYLGRVIVGG